ncbi:MAG: tetratricopeptide repeat protein [Armatimonadota bacterium]
MESGPVSIYVLAVIGVVLVWGLVTVLRSRILRPVSEAAEAMARGDYLRAAERFREFARGSPFYHGLRLSARLYAGTALHLAGEYEAVIREMDGIDLAAWPVQLTGLVHRIRSEALLALGRLDQSEDESRLALQHGHRNNRPDDVAGAEMLLAAAALQRGHLAAAVQHLRPFVGACTPQNAGAFLVMAEVYRVRGEFDEAAKWAQAVLDLAFAIHEGVKRDLGAARSLRAAALHLLASIAADREQWARAEEHLNALQFCQPLPRRSAALANALLGIVYSAAPRERSADEYFDLAEQLCAAVPDDRRTLALVSAQRGRAALYVGDHEEALVHLRRALEHGAPAVVVPRVWYTIGLAHEAAGDADDARAAFERAQQAGQPDNRFVELARQRLGESGRGSQAAGEAS